MEFITVHTYRHTVDLDWYEVDKTILLPIDKIDKIESDYELFHLFFSLEDQKHFKIGASRSCITTSLKDHSGTPITIFACESPLIIAEMINSGDENRVLGLE